MFIEKAKQIHKNWNT